MTPKQVLLNHIQGMHSRLSHVNRKWTMAEMAKVHSNQHHRLSSNHYHEGVNLGPDNRPPGWYTGEGAVRRT